MNWTDDMCRMGHTHMKVPNKIWLTAAHVNALIIMACIQTTFIFLILIGLICYSIYKSSDCAQHCDQCCA